MNIEIFEKINTKEKAYWLGLLYADGWIAYVHKAKKDTKRLGLSANKKDKILVEKWCDFLGLDKNRLDPQKDGTIRVRFANQKLISDLIRIGLLVGKEKSNNIEFPKLRNKELDLAFLLGYFDGDGLQKTTRINSGSIKFLNDIKEKFGISNKIHTHTDKRSIDGREIKGKSYYMYLGAITFNQMMNNYKHSLPRKRGRFREPGEPRKNPSPFLGTKTELRNLVFKKPMTEIAKDYGVSAATIAKYCKKWNIKIPPRGYWNRKKK